MPSYRDSDSRRDASGNGRMPDSDELLRGLGLSGDGASTDRMSPVEDAVPLGFDASTDTRYGNSRGRRGSGVRLGDGQRQAPSSRRPAAGMVTEDETMRRRQEAFREMAGGSPEPARDAVRTRAPASSAATSRAVARSMAAQSQGDAVSAPPKVNLSGRSEADEAQDGSQEAAQDAVRGRVSEFVHRVAGPPSPMMPKNPIAFVRQYGVGNLPLWLYEYKLVLLPIAVFTLILGMMFNRYISLVVGIAMVAMGWAAEQRVADNDAILIYILGIATALVPFIL